MVAPPAVLLLRKSMPELLVLMMVALPAVLLSSKNNPLKLLLLIRALAAVLLLKKLVAERPLLSVALPAVLVLKKSRPPLMVALPAVLELLKKIPPLLTVMVAPPPFMMMPAPLNCQRTLEMVNAKFDAPAFNVKPPSAVPVADVRLVVADVLKNAVPVGTVAGFQLLEVLKSAEPGLASQVASCAKAGVVDNRPMAS